MLDQLAAGNAEMRLLLYYASVRYSAALLGQVVMRRSEARVEQSTDFVFLLTSLAHVVIEGDVYLELRHRFGNLLGLLVVF